jgi:hypothetical protein
VISPDRKRPSTRYSIVYLSEADAFSRVEGLKHYGIWPGVVTVPGGYALTVDLPVTYLEIKSGIFR